MRTMINVMLTLALGVLIVLTWTLRRDFTERNTEILPGMVDAVPYEPQREYPLRRDGTPLGVRGGGTMPAGTIPLHYGKTLEEAARAGIDLSNPISDTSKGDVDRGVVVFTTFCQPCHGAGALGDGTVVKRGFPPPPSLLVEKARKMKDGQMFHILTYGQGNMPSLASQISEIDRWRVITHVRGLQAKAVSAPASSPPPAVAAATIVTEK